MEYDGDNISLGLQYIKDSINEHILTDPMLPVIPSAREITLEPNRVLIQIPA